MPLIETEEAARRLARAIASDLSLYNEEKILLGVQNDNLFSTLSEEVEEGRALYKSRVAPDLYQRNFYDRATHRHFDQVEGAREIQALVAAPGSRSQVRGLRRQPRPPIASSGSDVARHQVPRAWALAMGDPTEQSGALKRPIALASIRRRSRRPPGPAR